MTILPGPGLHHAFSMGDVRIYYLPLRVGSLSRTEAGASTDLIVTMAGKHCVVFHDMITDIRCTWDQIQTTGSLLPPPPLPGHEPRVSTAAFAPTRTPNSPRSLFIPWTL